MTITNSNHATPEELSRSLSLATMERAYKDGVNLSRWLEENDPSDRYSDGLDAFERQLQIKGIRTNSNAERGFYASDFGAFDEDDATRVLGIEWMARQYRKVRQQSRAVVSSDITAVGSAVRPYVDAAAVRMSMMQPAIPVSELIAYTTRIDSNAYRALYLNDDAGEYRMVRVGEAAEIPAASLTQGERTVELYKFGRRLDISYEALRRVPIDTVAHYIARMATQAEVDKVSQILNVIVNGDGNIGTAAEVVDLTTLDPAATANKLTLRAWLAFKLKFRNPYALTHELVREDVALQQLLMDTGSANVPLLTLNGAGAFGGFVPMNPTLADNVRYGILDEAPANAIVGIDSRFGIEQVTEIGGNITESRKWIERQVNVLTFTEVEGYAVTDAKAAKVLDLSK